MSPEEVINSIRRDEYSLGEDGRPLPGFEAHLRRQNRMSEQLSEGLYERSDHFIYELIQNAEDNQYAEGVVPTLKFSLLEADPTDTENSTGALCVFNNEVGFHEDNVRAICDFSNSTKKAKSGFIGEKGLGFKSVFMVSDSPHIFSNGYQFRFIRDDPIATIGYVVPYWLDAVPSAVAAEQDFTTAIILPLRKGQYSYIKDQLESYNPETLLFLKRLDVLEVVTPEQRVRVERSLNGKELNLSTTRGKETHLKRFWREAAVVGVPEELGEEKREGIKESEITVAFPLDGPTGDERVFAFLPTEERPGLPFIVNADFLLPSSRESILKNRDWNRWLLDEVVHVAVSGIKSMLSHPKLKFLVYRYVPLAKNVRANSPFAEVGRRIQSILKQEACVLDETGEIRFPYQCLTCSRNLRQLLEGPKPRFLGNRYLVNAEVAGLSEQLKVLGVKPISEADLPDLFADRDWIASHSNQWLLDVYKYLLTALPKARGKRVLRNLDIVRTEKGQVLAAVAVFAPLDEDEAAEFQKVPEGYRHKVNFVDADLYLGLALDEDAEDLLGSFKFEGFSAYSFMKDILVPELNAGIGDLSVEDFKLAFEYFLHVSLQLEDHLVETIAEEMPILERKSRLAARASVEGKQLVTPEDWDSQTGWQLIFDADDDCDRMVVMNSYYTSLRKKGVQRYFDAAEVTAFPDARQVDVTKSEARVVLDEEYRRYIFEEFFDDHRSYPSTSTKRIRTWIPSPKMLANAGLKGNRRAALVRWLNMIIGSRRYEITNGGGTYYYYSARHRKFESALLFSLKRQAWIDTTKGLRPPKQVFVRDKTLANIFGNKLAFLKDELTDTVIDALGINRDADTDTLLGFLESLRSAGKSEKSTLVAIYQYLDDYGGEYKEKFADEPLIYLPVGGGSWFTSQQVVWEDASAVADGLFGWLSNYYPNKLREFFVEKIGVKPEVENITYVDAWLRMQEAVGPNETEVERMLTAALPSINRALADNQENWVPAFKDQAEVWTQDKTWAEPGQVYVPDDRRLRALFSATFYYPWLPDNLSHERMEPVYRALEIERLSGAAEYSVSDVKEIEYSSQYEYLTDHTVRLIFYAVHNIGRDDDKDLASILSDGTGETLVSTREAKVESLKVNVEVDGYHEELGDRSAFYSADERVLFISEAADRDDVLDDIMTEVSRLLWGHRFKAHQDKIRRLLGVNTETRFRKLRDSDDWHLPRHLSSEIDRLIKERRRAPDSDSRATQGVSSGSEQRADERSQDDDVGQGEELRPEKGTEPAASEADRRQKRQPEDDYAKRLSIGDSRRSGSAAAMRNGRGGANAESSTASSGGAWGGASRSGGLAGSINSARRSRMRSYVSSELVEDFVKDGSCGGGENARKEMGGQGEQAVLEDLHRLGYPARRMSENNPGYDIEATNPMTGEIMYVEVKSESFGWSEKGVALSATQYGWAKEKRNSFYLAVVENMRSSPRNIYYVQDPVGYITDYHFDLGWRELATSIRTCEPTNSLPAHERLIDLTSSDACQDVIRYCDSNSLPLPEVGLDLVDHDGAVLDVGIELAWEEEKIGIVVTLEEADYIQANSPDWRVFVCDDKELIIEHLSATFGHTEGVVELQEQ